MKTQFNSINIIQKRIQQNNSQLPNYKKLYEAIRQAIIEGDFVADDCLPSSRQLSFNLKLSRNTVITALEQLCAEGYTIAKNRRGIFISSSLQESNYLPKNNDIKLSKRGKRMSVLAPMTNSQLPFSPGTPDISEFPYRLWQRYINRYAKNPKISWQTNHAKGGCYQLREILVDYLREARGIKCKPQEILITQGTQFSLRLAAELLTDVGNHVWMEDPGYHGAFCAFDAASLEIKFIPVDEQGLILSKQSKTISPRLIYTTPSHQFPTGVVMSASRRQAWLDFAKLNQSWILEDDYDSEFRYESSPVAAMRAITHCNVIYLGTFSKLLFPTLKIAYMILPEPLVDDFKLVQARHFREANAISQCALADYLIDGHAQNHIRKMRKEYQQRRDNLIELLQNNLKHKIKIAGIETGLHIVIYFNPKVDDKLIQQHALKRGLGCAAISNYTYSKRKLSGLILGFGYTNIAEIKQYGKVLVDLLNKMLR